MKRRQFLLGLSAAPLAGCGLLSGPPQLDFSLSGPTAVHIDTRKRGTPLGVGTLGLGFDTALLTDPRLLTAGNPQLLGLLNGLGPHGVICLGGRSTHPGIWLPNGGTLQKPYQYSLTTSDIDRLASLIDRCGWSLIYSLDLGHGDPTRTANEAAYVHSRIGKRVLAFELGDAPERHVREHLRQPGSNVDTAISDWRRYADAIHAQVPDAPLAGPATGDPAHPDWTESFVKACVDDLHLVTAQASSHEIRQQYGQQGNGSLAGHMFGLDNEQQAGLDRIAATARHARLPCRITQARAVEQGHDVDTLGAALWAIDLFYNRCGNATAPWAGICFHDAMRPTTPNTNPGGAPPLHSGPLYYALRLLALTLPAQPVGSAVVTPPAPGVQPGKDAKTAVDVLRSHALLDQHQRLRLVLINPDANNSIDVKVSADVALRNGRVLRLLGAGLDATSEVTLASGSTDANGNWRPLYTDTAQIDKGDAYLTVSAGSAVLVLFG